MQRPSKLLRRARGNALYGPAFFIGFIAGISIPAYHDYTVRSHVTQGLNLAVPLKAAVAEHFHTSGKWPRDLRELQFDAAPRAQYVTFAAVNRGTVVIRYSAAGGAALARQQLTLRPSLGPNDDIVWSCGYAQDLGEDPATGAASPHATTLPRKYLPSLCRG